MNKNDNGVFSQKLRAGRRRTYFFDVRPTRSEDFYITITEKKKRADGSFERHKLYIYKEDFNKFLTTLESTVNHVKEELLPDYDFDEFTREAEPFEDYNPEEFTQDAQPENKEESSEDFDIEF